MQLAKITEQDLGWEPGMGMLRPSADILAIENRNAFRNREMALKTLAARRKAILDAGQQKGASAAQLAAVGAGHDRIRGFYEAKPMIFFRMIKGLASGSSIPGFADPHGLCSYAIKNDAAISAAFARAKEAK